MASLSDLPCEVLREWFMLPYKLNLNKLALRRPSPTIHEIVNEDRAIYSDKALRVARFFGTTPESWVNLRTAFVCASLAPRLNRK
jgi:addiction module HigA family antidote